MMQKISLPLAGSTLDRQLMLPRRLENLGLRGKIKDKPFEHQPFARRIRAQGHVGSGNQPQCAGKFPS